LTRTPLPSITLSKTLTRTPLPAAFKVTVKVYNAAGEEVALLYSGGVTSMPGSPTLSGGVVQPGYQGTRLGFSGVLDSGLSTLSWDGTNNSGGPVSGGVYSIHVESTDPFGGVSSYNLSVSVIQSMAGSRISIFNSAGELVYHEDFHALSATVTDLALDQSAFSPAAGKLNGTLRSGAGVSSAWSWDGKGMDGQLLSPGVYTIQLNNQVAGETSKPLIRQVQIIAAPDATDAAPLLLSTGGAWVLRYQAAAVASGLSVRLYNLAGELVGSAPAGGPSGEAVLPSASLSSGVYVVVFEYQAPSGLRKRSLIKAALLR
jgi:hypothetical protein